MSLADFMRQLQEQDSGGLVYSKPPEKPVKVIPPEKTNVRILPPTIEQSQPKVLKLRLDRQAFTVPKPTISQPTQVSQPTPVQVQQPAYQQPVQPSVQQPRVPQPVVVQTPQVQPQVTKPVAQTTPQPAQPVEPKQLTPDELFARSGTEIGKQDLWLDYYNKALASRKDNPVVERMRLGRFTITPDDKVMILPDYDVVGKDPDDIIKDKWF